MFPAYKRPEDDTKKGKKNGKKWTRVGASAAATPEESTKASLTSQAGR